MRAKRSKIDLLTVADRVGCHPSSVPRFVREKRGFPKPFKLHGKNWFWEDEVDGYVEDLLRASQKGAA